MYKKLNNPKGFSLVELVVVIAIIGILVMLATPKFLGYVEKSELARVQHDVKIMQDKMEEELLHGDTNYNEWSDNAKDLRKLILAERLFENEGLAKNIQRPRTVRYGDTASSINLLGETSEIDFSDYKIIPSERKSNTSSSLPGTFYSNRDGKVYYEHDKPLINAKEKDILRCQVPEPDYDFEHRSGTIVKYNGSAEHLVIPSSFLVDGQCWSVRIIGRGAFMQGGYKSIVIPNTVIKIDDEAFKRNDLDKVIIPPSVTEVGNSAFSDNKITNEEPNEDTSGNKPLVPGVVVQNKKENIVIKGNAFNNNGVNGTTLIEPEFRPVTDKEIKVSISINKDKDSNGNKTGSITEYKGNDIEVVIPSTIFVDDEEVEIIKIEEGAYQGKGLISVILPEGLERIEDYAFSGNQLAGITIPNSVNHIGNYAFAFNELEKIGNIIGPKTKSTIKTIIIKKIEQFNKLDKYGDIYENDKKVDVLEVVGDDIKVKLLDHIFVTSHGNLVVDVDDKRSEEIINGFSNAEIQALIDEGYIPIVSPEDLNAVRNNNSYTFGEGTSWAGEYTNRTRGLSGKYIQVANIDMSSVKNFKPIGGDFRGVYDGGRFIISNLTMNRNANNTALFAKTIGGSEIRNVGLEDVIINGGEYYTAALVGYKLGNIKNSYSTGVIAGRRWVGGLVGQNFRGKIEESYSDVSIKGESMVGGLAGSNAGQITNSYSVGDIDCDSTSGGLTGDHADPSATVINSYSIVESLSKRNNIGGLLGDHSSGTIRNSYYNSDIIRLSRGGQGLNTEKMKEQSSYSGWNFSTLWEMGPNGYPQLQWQNK